MTQFRFLPPAEAEFLEQISYYSAIRVELGSKFEQAVSAAVRVAVANPAHGSPRSKSTRCRLVKGFPFAVIYRATNDEVLVVAIAHLRKKPEYWAQRVE